eukprot:15442841-Alexandrium_andersonii.AAC.1
MKHHVVLNPRIQGAAVVVAPAHDLVEGGPEDLAAAAAERTLARPDKTGSFDSTVVIGDAASAAAGQAWIAR